VNSEQFMIRTRMRAKVWQMDFINQIEQESSSHCLVEEPMRSLSETPSNDAEHDR